MEKEHGWIADPRPACGLLGPFRGLCPPGVYPGPVANRIEHYLSQWEMLEPRGFRTYREAAAIFRLGRAKGVSLTTIDALIAAIALEHRASVFTLGKDFPRIARLTGLSLNALPGR